MKIKKHEEKEADNNKSRKVWLDDTTLNEIAKTSDEEENSDQQDENENES